MSLLLHALIPCVAAYILHSSPVLLHIYCPHPLSCCTCFSTFLMEMFLLSCFTGFSLYRNSRMPYYVSIKAYNSTIQEFCAVQYVKALWACRRHLYIEDGGEELRGEGSAGREG